MTSPWLAVVVSLSIALCDTLFVYILSSLILLLSISLCCPQCLPLLSQELLDTPQIAAVVKIANLLEQCQFVQFWVSPSISHCSGFLTDIFAASHDGSSSHLSGLTFLSLFNLFASDHHCHQAEIAAHPDILETKVSLGDSSAPHTSLVIKGFLESIRSCMMSSLSLCSIFKNLILLYSF